MTGTSTRRALLLSPAGALATLALAGCAPAGRTEAQPSPAAPAVPGGTLGLGIVGLIVEDLDRSLAFYRRLGLTVPDDVDTSSGAVRHRMPNDTIFWWETVEYNQAFDPRLRPTGAGEADRKVTLEFGFASADEVTAKHDELVAAGSPSYQTPISWNGGDIRFAMIIDPDGNRIGLRWPLAS